MGKTAVFALTLIGGLITLLLGIAVAAFGSVVGGSSILGSALGTAATLIGIWGIVCGLIIIISGVMINKGGSDKTWGIVTLVFSILGLLTGQGFFIGPILGLIGGILVLTTKTGAPAPKAAKK